MSGVVENVPGYGDISIEFQWADCEESERLTHGSVNEAVGEHLEERLYGVPPKRWPDTLDVDLYVQNEVTEEAVNGFAARLLTTLQDILDEDEEYGHPDDTVDWNDEEACRAKMREAVGFCMRNREIYYCRVVKTVEVNVMEWVKTVEPEWVRPTGSQDPAETAATAVPTSRCS
jgi:hypothetical protein